MARPKPGNYAIGPEGRARYRKAHREWLKKQSELKAKKTPKVTELAKKPVAKKPVAKKPVAKKPVAKKPVAKKPVAKKPVAKKPVAKKPVAKKPVAKKPVAKKPPVKKPVAKKPAAKRKPFDPPKRGRGRPKGSKNAPKRKPFESTTNNAPKNNKTLKIKENVNQTGKFLKDTGKQIYDAGKKGVGKLQTKLAAKDQTPQQAVPEGKSKGAKFAKKVNQKIGNYAKRVYNKAALDTFKFKTVMDDPSKRKINRSGVKRGIGAGAALTIGNALVNRLTKPKGMSNKEWSDFKAKKEQEGVEKRRKLIKKGYDFYGKRLKKVSSDLTGKKYDSSTEKNINKQKKANTKPSSGLKIKKTQYSSNAAKKKQNFGAATGTKKADKRFGTFREDPTANRKLQLERQDGKKETYSRRLSETAKKQTSETKTNKDKKKKQSGFIKTSKGTLARRGSVAARRAENRERARKRAQEMARRRLANK